MKSNEVGTTLKHPESFHGNVKNLSKRMKMKACEPVEPVRTGPVRNRPVQYRTSHFRFGGLVRTSFASKPVGPAGFSEPVLLKGKKESHQIKGIRF